MDTQTMLSVKVQIQINILTTEPTIYNAWNKKSCNAWIYMNQSDIKCVLTDFFGFIFENWIIGGKSPYNNVKFSFCK